MKKSLKKIIAVALILATLLGGYAVAAQATFLLLGAYPTVMWLTPLGLLAPVIWVAHKVVSLLAIIIPPPANAPIAAAALFIRTVLYPMWGIIW